jgi:hypothetical protein
LELTVANLGPTSLQSPGATPIALATIHGQLCTSDFIDRSGAGTIQFTVKKAANGSGVPQSITASGQLLLDDSVSGTSENLTCGRELPARRTASSRICCGCLAGYDRLSAALATTRGLLALSGNSG